MFTNIDLGAGDRWFLSGGAGGPASGAWETFWNIRSVTNQTYPGKGSYSVAPFGPLSINFVGITANTPSTKVTDGKWWEAIPPANLVPQNIYEAELALRLGSAAPVVGGMDAGSPAGIDAGSPVGAADSSTGGGTGDNSGGTGDNSGGTGSASSGSSPSVAGGSTSGTGGALGPTGSTPPGQGVGSSSGGSGDVGASGSAAVHESAASAGCSVAPGPRQGRGSLAGLLLLFGLAWAARRKR